MSNASLQARLVGKREIQNDLISPAEELFPENCWKGERVFVVGGGQSLRGFPFRRLKGEKVIAINRSHECGHASMVVTGDRLWLESNMPCEDLSKTIPVVYAYRPDAPVVKRKILRLTRPIHATPCATQTLWGRNYREGLSPGCSGIRAANLACILGASKVYLLGIDMVGGPSRHKWWHGGYRRKTKEQHYHIFKEHWVKAILQARSEGLEDDRIVNLSLISKLEIFPKQNWRDVL